MKTVSVKLPSGDIIQAEVASTPLAQQTGLLKYSSLPKDGAMLFPYSKPTDVNFHTIGMKFDIDICFLEKIEEKRAARYIIISGLTAGELDLASWALAPMNEFNSMEQEEMYDKTFDGALGYVVGNTLNILDDSGVIDDILYRVGTQAIHMSSGASTYQGQAAAIRLAEGLEQKIRSTVGSLLRKD